MKVLITGINGFVGQHLLRELESRGIDVWGLDLQSISNKIKSVNIVDKNQLADVLKEILPDYIIHLAGIANVDHSNLSLIYNINVNGTLSLLSVCSELTFKPGFLFVSSAQVYGNKSYNNSLVSENAPISPVNHYGASKAAGEMIVRAFSNEYGMEYVIARPFNHTGPGQTDKFVVPKIVNEFRKRSESIELGNIDTIRDYTDVRDVVKAYGDIIDNFKNGEIYNIAGGTGISIEEIFNKLVAISGHDMRIIKKDFLVRKNEIKSIIGSSDKLRKDTGWEKRISIDDTLKDMLFC